MDRKHHLLISLILAGCDVGAATRVCDPRRDDECGAGEYCAVDGDGVPFCAAEADSEGLQIGEACEGPSGCGPGLGCIDLYGASRCLPFCTPGLTDGDDACTVCEGEGELANCRIGSCLAVLPDRPDIGTCVLPCQPLTLPEIVSLDRCPLTARCDFVPEVDFPTCVAQQIPPAQVDEACHLIGACAPDLWCTPVDQADPQGLCLPQPVIGQGCGADRVVVTLSTDPLITVCAPGESG